MILIHSVGATVYRNPVLPLQKTSILFHTYPDIVKNIRRLWLGEHNYETDATMLSIIRACTQTTSVSLPWEVLSTQADWVSLLRAPGHIPLSSLELRSSRIPRPKTALGYPLNLVNFGYLQKLKLLGPSSISDRDLENIALSAIHLKEFQVVNICALSSLSQCPLLPYVSIYMSC
jgi:hypothetical protein